jgi:hypothetical protein
LESHLNINKLEDWYQFTSTDATKALAKILATSGNEGGVQQKRNSFLYLSQLLRDVYPAHEWLEWRFKRVSSAYWNVLSNQRAFFDWFEKRAGIDTKEKWYNVKMEAIEAAGGALQNLGYIGEFHADSFVFIGYGLLSHKYRNSIASALSSIYPEHNWKIWKFHRVPRSFWKQKTTQRAFLDDCAVTLGLWDSADGRKALEKWYHVDPKQITALDGGSVLALHQKSMVLALCYAYSEHEWKEWLFTKSKVPQNFWNLPSNRRRYMDWLASERLEFDPVKEPSRWYKITHDVIHKNFGGGLISFHYGDSVADLVSSVYSEHEWLEWKFEKTQDNWWTAVENQIKFLDWFAKQRNIKDDLDWTTVDLSDIREAGGM